MTMNKKVLLTNSEKSKINNLQRISIFVKSDKFTEVSETKTIVFLLLLLQTNM